MAMLPIIKSNIPFVMDTLGRSDLAKKDIITKYLQLEGFTDESEFGKPADKHGRYPFGMTFATCLQNLKKMGAISSPKRGVYSLEDESLILPAFISHKSTPTKSTPTKSPTPTVEPQNEVLKVATTVEPVVEDTPTVEATPTTVEVSVNNPSVIEAHIDTSTNELVENVGGSQDWRKPLDEVEDGYITSNVPSSVQVSTTTLETVEVQEEVVEASVEPEEVVEVVEATPVEETVVEDQEDDLFEVEPPLEVELLDDQDVQPSYNLQELRKSVSFDPCNVVLQNNVSGQYEVYRDIELRNIVLTQKGRDDYEVISMDVDLERISNIPTNGEKYALYAKKAIEAFDQAKNHKEGCLLVVKSVISCCKVCNHTDDFGGFVEPCMASDRTCVLKSVWADGATYVNPQDS